MWLGALISLAAFGQQRAADMEVACETAYVAGVLPANGHVGAPTDSVVTVFLLGECAASSYDVSVADSAGNVVAQELFELGQPGDRLTVEPGGLVAGERYDVTITPGGGWGEVAVTSFTAGSDVAAPLEGAPSAELDWLDYRPSQNVASVSADVMEVPDPAGAAWVELRDANDAVVAGQIVGTDPVSLSYSVESRRMPDEICATPVQVRVTGEELVGETICGQPDRRGGLLSCSTSGASPAWLALLSLLLLRRSR